jgi:predicted dinucleotide-binding enzyme
VSESKRIAVIGGGAVGRALYAGLAGAGHDLVMGVRDPADPKHVTDPPVHLADHVAAVSGAAVVILAVPVPALADVVPTLGLATGQIVVDATNAVRIPVPDGHSTVGDHVASLLPAGVLLVKAFNTIGAEHLGTGRIDGVAAFLPIAGDEAGLVVVAELAADIGFDVAELGDRSAFAMVEDHARLWIHLAFVGGWGRNFGFVVRYD